MSVYVDYSIWKYGRMKMCHMIADTEQELYEMVDKIGVQRKWKHNDHYDVCLEKKKLAIQNGAIEITTREAAEISYLKKMRKKRNIKRVQFSEDLKKLRTVKNYFNNEKERIRNGKIIENAHHDRVSSILYEKMTKLLYSDKEITHENKY